MRALKIVLGFNGIVFVVRAALNLIRPTSFYLEADAPDYAVEAVRVLGVTYAVVGLIQLKQVGASDRTSVRAVTWASLLFGSGISVIALSMGPSSTAFYKMRTASIAENIGVAGLYGILLIRESREAAASTMAPSAS